MKSINRLLSAPLTDVFIRSKLHPNHITLLSGLAGMLAFLSFCLGNRAGFILGAVFFEIFYILDNCDGEVARIKGLSSKFGSWLDTMVDYFVHVLGFGGITIGVYKAKGEPLVLMFGILAMLGVFLSFMVVVMQKVKNYGLAVYGMPKAPKDAVKKTGPLDRLIDVLSVGDFSLVVLLFAIFGLMEVLLWLAAIGANLFCLVLLIVNFRYLIGSR